MSVDLIPLVVFGLLALVVAGGALALSELLGPKRRDPEKETIYECGVPLLDNAREPFHIRFYLIAILFILFDIETVFIVPYVTLARDLGIFGLIEMGTFVLVLGLGLLYCWKRGALEWD
ncbi:MAG: NADH-quinone oxidoreductase subunit A [Planctomycetota bacterium]